MLSAAEHAQASRYLNYLEALVGAHGLVLETSSDFSAYQQTRNSLADQGGLDLPYRRLFSPAFVDLMPASGFWICGRDKDGNVVHLQAIRRDELYGVTLSDWWAQHFHRLFCLGAPGRWRATAPIVEEITGQVCYHGEVWVAPELARAKVGGLLGQYALVLSLITWQPNYVYGLMEPRVARCGFHVREGYMHQQPQALTWEIVPEGIEADDWIGWNTLRDLTYLTRQLPRREVQIQPKN